MSRTFVLPISANYINHWGIQEAVRELLQNALDSESSHSFNIIGSTLIISSPEAELKVSDLVLGTSSKQDDESKIGKFGEGFKLALAVLARENREIVVLNGNKSWIPVYRWSDDFQADILHVDEHDSSAPEPGLQFVLRNLTPGELQTIVHNCLHMHFQYPDHLVSTYGNILPHSEGKLYVNGLFVCDTDLHYSYDIKPEHLTLERDRQTVDNFDLRYVTGSMWLEQQDQWESLAEDIANNVPDVSYIRAANNSISDLVALKFNEQFGNAIAVTSQQEADIITARGGRAAVISYSHRSVLLCSGLYSPVTLAKQLTKKEELELYFAENKQYMRRKAIVAMKKLLESWS